MIKLDNFEFRKKLYCCCFIIVGYEQVASIIVLMGRACTTGAGNVVVIMQEELHPTPVRQKIVGLENGISLAITVAGPYITELVGIFHKILL